MSSRIPAFVAIGAAGLVVQMSVLSVLMFLCGVGYPVATVFAVEAALLSNFAWHERWTWRDRSTGAPSRLRRLLRYHVGTGATSIAGNLLLTAVAVEWLRLPPLPANALAVTVTSAANFLIADRWVFATPTTASFVCVLVLFPVGADAAELRAATVQAWDRHVAAVESRLDHVVVARAGASPAGRSLAVAGGTIHEWRGSIVIPALTVETLVAALETPGLPPPADDVLSARVLGKQGDTLQVYLRFVRSAILTVTYDSVHDVTFTHGSSGLATSRSVATSIREEGGTDHGFLWRLNSYWRYEQRGPDVVVTMLSLSLSREVPTLAKPVASPLIASIARESMVRTLAAVERFGRRLG